jgi:[acyl-carrier-protein] S-malonyltransferase
LRGVLALTDIADPVLPIVSGVTASYARNADAIRANLAAEAACPVRWVECVERLVADGYTTFVECGPGTTLAERIRRIAPGAMVYSVNDGATLAATKEALLAP